MSPDPAYIEEWKRIARKDWVRMQLLLDADDYDGAAFFTQQTIEKLLKGWLIERGWALKKTHELTSLLSDADKLQPGILVHSPICDRLSGYYFADRYPSTIEPGLTRDEVERDVADARSLISELYVSESW